YCFLRERPLASPSAPSTRQSSYLRHDCCSRRHEPLRSAPPPTARQPAPKQYSPPATFGLVREKCCPRVPSPSPLPAQQYGPALLLQTSTLSGKHSDFFRGDTLLSHPLWPWHRRCLDDSQLSAP